MKERHTDDALGYFSQNAKQFDDLYTARPGFYEGRVPVWHDLLDRYGTGDGLAIDMGCGPGVFTFYLAARAGRVIGVDGAANMIAICEARRRQQGLTNVSFVEARLPDVNELSLSDADLIISSSVVEYVADLDATLALFGRLLRQRGVLIISMPNVASLSRTYQRLRHKLTGSPDIYQYIRHFSSPRMLQRRVAHLGLALLESHYYTHETRLARASRAIGMPPSLTEDLFVAAFSRRAS